MNIYSIDKQESDLKYDQTKSEIPIDRHATEPDLMILRMKNNYWLI